jgi:hypothetical protein
MLSSMIRTPSQMCIDIAPPSEEIEAPAPTPIRRVHGSLTGKLETVRTKQPTKWDGAPGNLCLRCGMPDRHATPGVCIAALVRKLGGFELSVAALRSAIADKG